MSNLKTIVRLLDGHCVISLRGRQAFKGEGEGKLKAQSVIIVFTICLVAKIYPMRKAHAINNLEMTSYGNHEIDHSYIVSGTISYE